MKVQAVQSSETVCACECAQVCTCVCNLYKEIDVSTF